MAHGTNDHLTGQVDSHRLNEDGLTGVFGKMEDEIAISEFKARCLELLERLRTDGREIIVTKRGVPIARVSPLSRSAMPLRGSMRNMLEVKGEIVECDWSAEWEASK